MMTTPDKLFDKIFEATREEERLTEDEIARRKLGPRGVPGAPDTANDDAPNHPLDSTKRHICLKPSNVGLSVSCGCMSGAGLISNQSLSSAYKRPAAYSVIAQPPDRWKINFLWALPMERK
jgi:hypothetical protein